jgi:hypothetical protein
LRANLGPESRDGFGHPEGALVFASDPSPDAATALERGTLPGWSVTWHLV